jgi:hypothetical protein
LAAPPKRRARSRSPSNSAHKPPESFAEEADEPAEPDAEFEDVAVRAARLGVTVEKVLREYARIAFADLRHIASWDAQGLHIKERLSKADAAPISEIGTGAAGKGPVRIKLYDKKAALDAIARHLGMFTPSQRRAEEDDDWAAEVEEAREELARRLARLAAEKDEDEASRLDEPAPPRHD